MYTARETIPTGPGDSPEKYRAAPFPSLVVLPPLSRGWEEN